MSNLTHVIAEYQETNYQDVHNDCAMCSEGKPEVDLGPLVGITLALWVCRSCANEHIGHRKESGKYNHRSSRKQREW